MKKFILVFMLLVVVSAAQASTIKFSAKVSDAVWAISLFSGKVPTYTSAPFCNFAIYYASPTQVWTTDGSRGEYHNVGLSSNGTAEIQLTYTDKRNFWEYWYANQTVDVSAIYSFNGTVIRSNTVKVSAIPRIATVNLLLNAKVYKTSLIANSSDIGTWGSLPTNWVTPDKGLIFGTNTIGPYAAVGTEALGCQVIIYNFISNYDGNGYY